MTAFCACAGNGGMEWGAQREGYPFTEAMIHNMECTGVMLRGVPAEAG